MEDESDVLVSRSRGILVMTINRPQARNAATRAAAEIIAREMDVFEADDQMRVAVITGAGGTFCSGMDLKRFAAGERSALPGRGFLGLTEFNRTKPLIAAIEGYALAGGMETVLACDLAIAGASAKFGIPEVKRGLVAAAGGLMRLPRQLPWRVALELALTGEMFSAQRAFESGLINDVVDDGTALDAAIALAEKISENGPLATSATMQIMKQSRMWTDEEQFEKQRELSEPVFESYDAKEGARAFVEKRKPVWTGT